MQRQDIETLKTLLIEVRRFEEDDVETEDELNNAWARLEDMLGYHAEELIKAAEAVERFKELEYADLPMNHNCVVVRKVPFNGVIQ